MDEVELETKLCKVFTIAERAPTVINVKTLAGTFNKEKDLVIAFSMIVKLPTLRRFVSSSTWKVV